MTLMSGARAFLEMLRAEQIDRIFGNPGTSESAIMALLPEYPDIAYMLSTQEGVAMGMADGYAIASGRPAVVNLHIETGLANGISLLHHAWDGGAPLVLTAGNKDVRKLAEGRSDLTEMVRQFTKWSAEVTHPEQVAGVLRRAFQEAKNPPAGPVFVGFAANALDGLAEVEIVPSGPPVAMPDPDAAAVERAAGMLAGASNPVMIVGDRLAQAGGMAAAVAVAERLGAGVYAASLARANFPTGHPQFLGRINPTLTAGPAGSGRGGRGFGGGGECVFRFLLLAGAEYCSGNQADTPGFGTGGNREDEADGGGAVRRPQGRVGVVGRGAGRDDGRRGKGKGRGQEGALPGNAGRRRVGQGAASQGNVGSAANGGGTDGVGDSRGAAAGNHRGG